MQWEQCTADDFAAAVQETGVCILTLGVIERHSAHLPLGTDMYIGHDIACAAAQKEPAVVFPPFYFGQIYEAGCFPGTLTLKPTLLLELWEAVLDEIGRNGFRKIILYNAHGGNNHLVRFMAQASLWQQKPYTLYLMNDSLTKERNKAWDAILDTHFGGHADESETSLILACQSELVHMERVPVDPALPLARLAHLPTAYSGIWWYADFPEHYAGDARSATREKGLRLRQLLVDSLAEFIAAVKADTITPTLEQEFFTRKNQVSRLD